MEAMVEAYKALGDATRLRILHLLTYGELCVCDLVGSLDLPQPTVSRHLGILKAAGYVRDRRDRVWIHYRLANPESPVHEIQIACARTFFPAIEACREDGVRLKQLLADGCCKGNVVKRLLRQVGRGKWKPKSGTATEPITAKERHGKGEAHGKGRGKERRAHPRDRARALR